MKWPLMFKSNIEKEIAKSVDKAIDKQREHDKKFYQEIISILKEKHRKTLKKKNKTIKKYSNHWDKYKLRSFAHDETIKLMDLDDAFIEKKLQEITQWRNVIRDRYKYNQRFMLKNEHKI